MPKSKSKKNKAKKTVKSDSLSNIVPKIKKTQKDEPKKVEVVKVSNVLKLSSKSIMTIYNNWKVFTLISALYFFLTLLFVRGFSSTVNVLQVKNNYLGSGHGKSVIGSDLSVFGNVISSSFTGASGNGNLFQTLLVIFFSLVFIWMFREILNGKNVTFRGSLYNSQYPLTQFLVIIFFLTLELLPLTLGLFLYATVYGAGIAVNLAEQIGWFVIVFLFVATSFYFLVFSVFAIYIATLPGVRPIQALRSAWRLVKGRRLSVLRKILFLPIGLFIAISLISLIFIALIPQIADFVFFALSVISLSVFHSYLYNLYRELI